MDKQVERERIVLSICADIERIRPPTEELDDHVHHAASQLASGVNNGGVESQINFLLDQWGERAVRSIFAKRLEALP